MAVDSDPHRLSALKARIRSAQEHAAGSEKPAQAAEASVSGAMAMMMRIGTDFVASILTALLMGWGLDLWLGWAPWGMLVMLLLGFCAGLLRIARVLSQSAAEEERSGPAPDAQETKERNDGDAFPH